MLLFFSGLNAKSLQNGAGNVGCKENDFAKLKLTWEG